VALAMAAAWRATSSRTRWAIPILASLVAGTAALLARGGEWWCERTWGQEQWDVIARGEDDAMLCCCVLRDFVRNLWHVAGLYD